MVDVARPVSFKLHDFEKWVSGKYSFPAKTANDKPWIMEYLPWYQDLVKYNFSGVDAVVGCHSSFISELFGAKYPEIFKKEKQSYLDRHPALKEKREQMLCDLVASVSVNEEGKIVTIQDSEIKKLLKTIDNQLYISNPEYKRFSD